MQYVAYLRDQADRFRALAGRSSKADKPDEAAKYKDLAETCETVASDLEDHLPAG